MPLSKFHIQSESVVVFFISLLSKENLGSQKLSGFKKIIEMFQFNKFFEIIECVLNNFMGPNGHEMYSAWNVFRVSTVYIFSSSKQLQGLHATAAIYNMVVPGAGQCANRRSCYRTIQSKQSHHRILSPGTLFLFTEKTLLIHEPLE